MLSFLINGDIKLEMNRNNLLVFAMPRGIKFNEILKEFGWVELDEKTHLFGIFDFTDKPTKKIYALIDQSSISEISEPNMTGDELDNLIRSRGGYA